MICTECKSDLYCIDSRYVRRKELTGTSLRTKNQIKIRFYSCPNRECNNRFVSTEVLNPQPTGKKLMPKSKRKIILGESS